jgi:Tfp pilus assembly protein PilV
MNIRRLRKQDSEGFSLIEVLLGIALIGFAMLGLAQMFVLSVWNNHRADTMSNATFLAQQEIDTLRTMTGTELAALPTVQDEQIDVNGDNIYDYRRITQIDFNNFYFSVWVFAADQMQTPRQDLLNDPAGHRVMAQMSTVIIHQ